MLSLRGVLGAYFLCVGVMPLEFLVFANFLSQLIFLARKPA
jgi:hypothetical protein